jgi:hypothetical protein
VRSAKLISEVGGSWEEQGGGKRSLLEAVNKQRLVQIEKTLCVLLLLLYLERVTQRNCRSSL